MLQVEEAQTSVMAEVSVGSTETVRLFEAHGRVLREDVVSHLDLPPADNSAMDGYALRAADTIAAASEAPVELRVVGDVPAGHPSDGSVEPGSAMRIMTGAFVPEDADAVVQVELTDAGRDVVKVYRAIAPGANIRRRGEDVRNGDVVLEAGRRIGAAEMAMLAAMQKREVVVGRRPVVAILSTGDELVDVDGELTAGKIVNTNAYLLASLVRDAGAEPRVLGIVPDTRDETIAAVQSALESDFVVSSGGVSVGAYDFVKDALDAVGAETKFWRVAMKPGKPVVLSRARGSVYFGLPGNPVSCFVAFHLFVGPALRKAAGERGSLHAPQVSVRMTGAVRGAGDRRVYVRVHVFAEEGELRAGPLTAQGSGSLTSMIDANGLAIVESGVASVEAGEIAPVLLIGNVG